MLWSSRQVVMAEETAVLNCVMVVQMVGDRYFLHFMSMRTEVVQAVVKHHLIEQLLEKRSVSPDASTQPQLPDHEWSSVG
jgi:hypothetical protein